MLAKIAFIFFCAATVIIFLLSYQGMFIAVAGSEEAAIRWYVIDVVGLIISILWYSWQRAYRDIPGQRDIDILGAYGDRMMQDEAEVSRKKDTLSE